MSTHQRANEILNFWFGPGNESDLPSAERTHLWFGMDPKNDVEIKEKFEGDLWLARDGDLNHWVKEPRSNLALVIILDQFSRHIYRGTKEAFAQDEKALDCCISGLKNEDDQHMSLIERVFFYLPLEHSEDLVIQENSVQAYENLLELSLVETRSLFKLFYDYALKHHDVIKNFKRFPHRNVILGRESTPEELEYLEKNKNFF